MKDKIVVVEMYFSCREDADPAAIASIAGLEGHKIADRSRAHAMRLPDEDSIKFSGVSYLVKTRKEDK